MFKGHPKGLYALALANTGERFGYYTMLAVFALFLRENFGLDSGTAGAIYSTFLGLVYFMPLIGGMMADKFGFGRMVTTGIMVMFGGYLLLSAPLGGETVAMIAMMAALVLISVGTGLFKGNLQVMVGNLYDDPKYADKRDSGFSLFYMAINVGSLFAPTTAVGIKAWAEQSLGYSSNDAYHFSFMVACAALILSILIYFVFRPTFRHVEGGKKKGEAAQVVDNLTPAETKQRIVALCLVFAVVIFFWMAFHQNGLTLTYFADEFTATNAFGFDTMLFDVWNLALIIVAVYATFSIFQSNGAKGKILSGVLASGVLAFLVYRAMGIDFDAHDSVAAPIFQQFNPFYVVALTPVSMAIFGALARKGKEPSAPRKIALGMLVAAIGFAIMAFGSQGLNTPNDQQRAIAINKGEAHAAQCYDIAPSVEQKKKDGKITYILVDENGEEYTDQRVLKMTQSKDKAVKAEGDKIKATRDFIGKLNDKTGPVFYEVYNAQSVIAADVAANATTFANECYTVANSVAVKYEVKDGEFAIVGTVDEIDNNFTKVDGKYTYVLAVMTEEEVDEKTVITYEEVTLESLKSADETVAAKTEEAMNYLAQFTYEDKDTKKNLNLASVFYTAYNAVDAPEVIDVVENEEVTATDKTEEANELAEATANDDATITDAEQTNEAKIENNITEEAKTTAEPTMTVDKAEQILAGYADQKEETRTSPYWLILTYLVLTFAELLLSPMGISFVSKVAPPKLKGLMMGGWFVATAIGNLLVMVGGYLWAGLPLWSVWAVFVALCLISALFMFVMMKRLESATK